jgi:hypothetical protein
MAAAGGALGIAAAVGACKTGFATTGFAVGVAVFGCIGGITGAGGGMEAGEDAAAGFAWAGFALAGFVGSAGGRSGALAAAAGVSGLDGQ